MELYSVAKKSVPNLYSAVSTPVEDKIWHLKCMKQIGSLFTVQFSFSFQSIVTPNMIYSYHRGRQRLRIMLAGSSLISSSYLADWYYSNCVAVCRDLAWSLKMEDIPSSHHGWNEDIGNISPYSIILLRVEKMGSGAACSLIFDAFLGTFRAESRARLVKFYIYNCKLENGCY